MSLRLRWRQILRTIQFRDWDHLSLSEIGTNRKGVREHHKQISEKRREQAIVPDDLPIWRRQIEAHENPIRRDLQKFGLLTGMRRAATVTARWEHFDREQCLLFVPNPRGAERAFWLPVSGYLADLLYGRKNGNEVLHPGSPWIWPADSASSYVTWPKENKHGRPSPHLLRHSYATFAKAAGLNELDSRVAEIASGGAWRLSIGLSQ